MPEPIHVIKPIAKVEECTKIGTLADFEGAEATIFQVTAEMYVPAQKYLNGIFKVKVIKPEGIAYLMPDHGARMEHGSFSFDSLKELAQGDELEVEISEY
jgi:hypothetical protein